MESVNESTHYFLAAFLFTGAVTILLLLTSMHAKMYQNVSAQAQSKASVFESEVLTDETPAPSVTKAEAIGIAFSLPSDVSFIVNGTDLAGEEVHDMPLLQYARQVDASILTGATYLQQDSYFIKYAYDSNGSPVSIELTGLSE